MKMIEKIWNPPAVSERQATRAERRKKTVKFWNPIRAWQSAKQAWQDNRRKTKENDDKGKAVVTGRTIFVADERRAYLKKLAAGAAVTAVMSTTTLLLGSDPARAAQLANFVQFVGVGDGATDDSAALNGSINTCAAQPSGGAVFIPPPSVSYVIDNIALKSAVDIIGGSMRQTQFLAKAGSTNNMFVLDVGHVINCRYENFVCNPNGNANQNCFMLQATSGGSGDGGMWYCIFKNIYINAFGGYGIWFRGGPNGFNLPHQFITIDSCIIWHPNTTYARSTLMTGQVGQIKVQGVCDFSGTGGTFVGYGMELSAEYVNTGAPAGQQHGGVLVGGTPVGGSNTPYNITIDTATIQNCLTAIYTSNPSDVTIENCYFENVAQVLVAESVTNGMNIRNCHFTNCGAFSGAGFILKMADQSCGSITGCDVVGCDRFIANGTGNGGGQVYSAYNFMWNAPTNLDTNRSINVGGPTAAMGFFFMAFINNTTPITAITSRHTVGDIITFVNDQGSAAGTFIAGNNIKLGSKSILTLPGAFDTATFQLSEVAGGWQLIGTTGTLGVTTQSAPATTAFTTPALAGAWAFSNSNRTVLEGASPVNGTVLLSNAVTGKQAFSVNYDASDGVNYAVVGLSDGTLTATPSPGFTNPSHSIGYLEVGQIWFNNANVAANTAPSWNNILNSKIGVVVDGPNKLAWFTIDGVNFFGVGGVARTAADVAAGTGGYDLSALLPSGSIFGCVGSLNDGNKGFTLQTSWPAGWTLPSGFTLL